MKQLKLITKLRGLIVLALALVMSGNAWADTAEISFTSTSGSSSQISYTSTNSSTGGNGSYLKVSSNGTLTISCSDGYQITGISFTGHTGGGGKDKTYYSISTRTGSVNTGTLSSTESTTTTASTWTGTATSITFTSSASNAGAESMVVTYEESKPADPTISPASGTFEGSQNITLACTTSDATIYYTTDGTDPSSSSTAYSAQFTIGASAAVGTAITVKAIAINTKGSSEIVSATYTKVAPKAITSFTAASSTVKVGATTTATLVKADGYEGEINYSITNNGAATVTQNGDAFTIVGVANGTVVINATATDETGFVGNSVTLTITVTTSHIPSNYSTSWTTSNQIYLYNKATGLYLGSGGHWGTEGILKTTGLPFYMNAAASEKSDATGVGMFSDSGKTTAHRVGYQSSAQVFGIENQGIYIDAGTNYPTQTFSFYFNSDDNSYSIVPDAMVTGIEISGTDDDGNTVYLTPSSASSLSWTTTPYYWSMNSSNQIYTVSGTTASSLGTKYYLYAYGTTLSLTTSASTASVSNGKIMFAGTYYLTGNSTTLTTTSGDTNANAVIYEQGTTSKFYLTQNGGTNVARQNVVTVRQYSTTDIPDEARWFVVTKADLIEDFENATATDASPKEATFLLLNSDFSREVDQAWTFEQPTGTSYTSQTSSYGSNGYIRIGNALFNNAGANNSINNSPNSVEVAGTAIGSGSYGGNGSGYTLDATAAAYANLPEGTSTYYNIPYGGFYNCRILGNSGKVYQQVTITKAGYYRVSCDGYVYNPSSATGTATFYAKNASVSEKGKQYVSCTLPTNATFETMTDAGITFYANGGTSAYHNSILVYMPVGTMEVGVILTGGTIGTVKNSNTNTFAEFDAMKIEYTGNSQYDIILDESLTTDNIFKDTDQEQNIHYINAQVQAGVARTMYLRRSMKAGQWNSIVLPVNISNSAFNTAFGASTKLTKYQKCEGNTIYFEIVDHSDETSTTPAMAAGKCYLIKPASLSAATEGTFTTLYANASGSISVEASATVPVFQFNQVTLGSTIEDDPTYDGSFQPVLDTEITDYLAFMGTYFYNSGAIGKYSYALNSADGKWYRYIGKDGDDFEPMACKGFRCWVGQNTSDPIPTEEAKMLMVIDDEEVNPTDIAGVTVKQPTLSDNRVYSVSGQLVGTSDNTSKLPKGIYISNGKKFIVK